MTSNNQWSPEAVARLRELYNRYTCTQIAKMLNQEYLARYGVMGTLSRNAVIGKISRLGLNIRYASNFRTNARNGSPARVNGTAKKKDLVPPIHRGKVNALGEKIEEVNLSSASVMLQDLEYGKCKVVLKRDTEHNFICCGNDVVHKEGTSSQKSYCLKHYLSVIDAKNRAAFLNTASDYERAMWGAVLKESFPEFDFELLVVPYKTIDDLTKDVANARQRREERKARNTIEADARKEYNSDYSSNIAAMRKV